MGRSVLAGRVSVAAVVVAATAGVLLQSGTLDPALALAVDAVTSRSSSSPSDPAASPERVQRVSWSYETASGPSWSAGWPPRSSGTPRHKQQQFDPGQPATPARPAQPELPVGTPLDSGLPWRLMQNSVNELPSLAPMTDCPQPHGPSVRVPIVATAVKGGAIVTWWNLGDPTVSSYRVGALPVSGAVAGAKVTWVTVPSPRTCTGMKATVRGLVSGQSYMFYLESVGTNRLRSGAAQRTRGHSNTVVAL